MNKPLISIIIPCYNAEKYIDRCVSSLIRQTIGIDRLQLIFVDDASDDSTAGILEKYEQLYPDSIVIIRNDEHHCPGGARNIGIEYALADLIGYCDIDDWIEDDMYELLYEQAVRYPYDIVYCKYTRAGRYEDAVRDDQEYHFTLHGNVHWSKEEITKVGNNGYFGRMCWAGLYRKSFLNDNGIYFPEDLIHEDIFWMELVQLHASSAYIVDKVLYHYEMNNNSVTSSRNNTGILDRMPIELMLIEEYGRRGAMDVFRDKIAVDFIHRFYINTLNLLFTRFDVCPNVYDEIHGVIYELFPDWDKLIDVGSQDAKVRFLLTLLMRKESLSDRELAAYQKAYLEM